MKQQVTEALKNSVPIAVGMATGTALAPIQKGSFPMRILTIFLGGIVGGIIFYLGIAREKTR